MSRPENLIYIYIYMYITLIQKMNHLPICEHEAEFTFYCNKAHHISVLQTAIKYGNWAPPEWPVGIAAPDKCNALWDKGKGVNTAPHSLPIMSEYIELLHTHKQTPPQYIL
jgi:hypothetical protein